VLDVDLSQSIEERCQRVPFTARVFALHDRSLADPLDEASMLQHFELLAGAPLLRTRSQGVDRAGGRRQAAFHGGQPFDPLVLREYSRRASARLTALTGARAQPSFSSFSSIPRSLP
jgi:hypothetical protein